jgi:hypothetical protein
VTDGLHPLAHLGPRGGLPRRIAGREEAVRELCDLILRARVPVDP